MLSCVFVSKWLDNKKQLWSDLLFVQINRHIFLNLVSCQIMLNTHNSMRTYDLEKWPRVLDRSGQWLSFSGSVLRPPCTLSQRGYSELTRLNRNLPHMHKHTTWKCQLCNVSAGPLSFRGVKVKSVCVGVSGGHGWWSEREIIGNV